MRLLRPGQETVLSWKAGAVECRVVAAAGSFVLLAPVRGDAVADAPAGAGALTYLDGMVPMGWDGQIEAAGQPGELRFRVDGGRAADRRSFVRVPVFGTAALRHGDVVLHGQLLDVSAGGLRLRHAGRVPSGTPVRVRTDLPDGLLIDADGVVRLSEPGVSAVEFTTLHAADAQTIGAWAVAVLRASLSTAA